MARAVLAGAQARQVLPLWKTLHEGKAWVACAIARQACRLRRSTRCVRMPDLLMERAEARCTERSDAKILRRYSGPEPLVIDEWLTSDLSPEEVQFLFELVERRYGSSSTLYCSQYRVGDWHARLGGGVRADAVLDRMVHGRYT